MKSCWVLNTLFLFFILVFFFLFVQGKVPRSTKHRQSHPLSRKSKPGPKNTLIFNVLSFGAVGNGINDDSEAFKKAWETACQSKKSAFLLVPAKYSFMIQASTFTGPCKSRLIFQIDGTLLAPDGPKAWKQKNGKLDSWVVFKSITGMSLQGSGLIDGRGQKWWNLPNSKRPKKAISFDFCFDLTMRGVRIKNSPTFHMALSMCKNVHVERIGIKAPADSPNTDGIHLEKTNNVKIYNSFISSGDDCISIGTGCHNVDIRNVTCGPSHGISIGSLGRDKSRASNITVSDSVIKHSTNGVRIKTWQGGSGAVSKITFQNIKNGHSSKPNYHRPILLPRQKLPQSNICTLHF